MQTHKMTISYTQKARVTVTNHVSS